MKIVAMGLTFGPKSFFRVGWNYMDVFIIITGLLFSLIPPLREAKACTIITMFRAFKLAYSTTPMRRLMSPWLHALRKMANVFAVLVFIILTFASTGIGEFGGSRYFRCRTTPAPVDGVWEVDESIYRLCNAHGHGSFDCPAGTYCGTPYDYGLEATHDEMYGSELIAYGAPGYENIMRAFFISFQVATCDDWVKVMYRMQDSDNAILSRLFFPCFIFIGSFLCMNLIVAVIVDTFQNHREALLEKDKLKRSRVRRGHEIRGESSQIALRDNEAPMQEAQEENEFVGGKEAEGKEEEVEASPEQDKEESIDKMAQKNTKSVKTSRIRNKEENESFRALCMKVKESKVYQLTILGLILFNLFILAMNRQGISDTELKVYNIFDIIIAAAFFLEMVVEFNALGPLAYLRTRYIDIVTNILSVIELVFTWTDNYDKYSIKGIIVGFRVLRTMKLVGKWQALTEILNFLWDTSNDILHFSILLCMFIFLFATIGYTLFSHQAKLGPHDNVDLVNGETIRIMNFDTITYSFLAVFTIQITDNWTPFFYQYTRFNSAAYFFFPLGVFTLNIIMMNLFVAILLEKFFSDDQKSQMVEEEKRNQAFNERQKKIQELNGKRAKYKNRVRTLLTALKAYNAILSLGSAVKKKPVEKKGRMVGKSLNLFTPESKIRVLLNRVIYHNAFMWLNHLCIALNSVLVTFFIAKRDPKGRTMKIVNILDIITTLFFCLEIIGKIIVSGFINNGPKSFVKDKFNVVDLTVTVIDAATTFYVINSTLVMKILKFIRSIRLLRFISMNKGFRLRIKALAHGSPKILQTILIISLFILMFTIVGVQLFGDFLHYCSTDNVPEDVSIDTIYDCLDYGGEWSQHNSNLSNSFLGFLTLFELFTGKAWCNLVTYLCDIYDYDHVGRRDVSLYNLWFPVIYMILGFLCFKSMLSSVISNAFYFHNENLQGLRTLTGVQRRWVSLTKVMFKASPMIRYDPNLRFYSVYAFLQKPAFQFFITLTIVMNGVVLCMEMFRPPDGLGVFCDICHYTFLAIYGLEAGLKLFFYKQDFFRDSWSTYDLVILLCLFVTTVVHKNADIKFFKVMLYILRALKICVLFNKLKILRDIFQVFVLALPSVINSALLFLLMVYIFAIIGNCLLSDLKWHGQLNQHANFESIITAFITVFRLSTFDGWNDLMRDTMHNKSPSFYCVPNPSYNEIAANGGDSLGCGSRFYAIYFIIAILFIPFMFLNIFVAIVVASVTEIAQLSESVLSDERLGMFLAVWKKYDAKAGGFVEYSRVWNFLHELPEPLGAGENQMSNRYYSAMTQWMLQLRIFRSEETGLHYVSFYDVLEGLVKKSLYKPQTLDKIYNNLSKETLIKGLQELWDQRTQLAMDSDNYMSQIEDLHYYYELKKSFEARSNYKVIKANLPFLVWIILKISKHLKSKVKESLKREKENDTSTNLPAIPEYVGQMTGSREKEDTKEQDNSNDMYENETVARFIERSITREVDGLTVMHFGGQRFEHNVPKMPNKMKNKMRPSVKGRKHNVPTEFQTNESRFQSGYKKSGNSNV